MSNLAGLPFTDIDGEPRVSAEALGRALAYRNSRRLRHFARRRMALLEQLGPVVEVERKYRAGRGNLRVGVELMLNQAQARCFALRRKGGVDATLALVAGSHGLTT